MKETENNINRRLRIAKSFKIKMEIQLKEAIKLANEAELYGTVVKLQNDLDNSDKILKDYPYV